jgi:hypothetical protein
MERGYVWTVINQGSPTSPEAADDRCGMKDGRQRSNIVVGHNVLRDNHS